MKLAPRHPSSVVIWAVLGGFGLLALGLAISNRAVLPAHVSLDGAHHWLSRAWIGDLWMGVFLLLLVAYLVQRFHEGAARPLWALTAAGGLATLYLFSAMVVRDSLNILLDRSPVRRASTTVLSTHVPPGSKTLQMTLRNVIEPGGAPIQARDSRGVIRVDSERRHATFHWREGFFGYPYAIHREDD